MIQHQRVKYACPCCDLGIKVTPAPPRLIPRGLLTESALAWIAAGKFQFGMPLYRQAGLLRRFGGDISSNTIAASMVKVGLATQPVINLMRDALLESAVIPADETTFQVLKEKGGCVAITGWSRIRRPHSLTSMMAKTKTPRKTLYVKVKGQCKYLHRAVDKDGNTVDFLLRAHRDKAAAFRYFRKAIDQNGEPETVTVDKGGANLAALEALNAERATPIKIRQNKYLNNIFEQDHRAIKRIIRPMMGFRSSGVRALFSAASKSCI